MADFDSSSQKVGGRLNIDTSVSLMNSLATRVVPGERHILFSMAANSFALFVSATVALAADEIAVADLSANYSISNTSTVAAFALFADTTQLGLSIRASVPFAAADGFTHFVDMKRYILGSPGSHTISGQVCQAVGSGTIYVSSANLNIYVFKSRS